MLGNAHARKEKYDMSLKNRHFLKLLDFTPEELTAYLDLAADIVRPFAQQVVILGVFD